MVHLKQVYAKRSALGSSEAIAATLGTATGRLQKVSDLEWAGFNYELLASNWGGMTPI